MGWYVIVSYSIIHIILDMKSMILNVFNSILTPIQYCVKLMFSLVSTFRLVQTKKRRKNMKTL